ncbi:hypothetical protein BCR44DRAFT_34135 [Catenaria anguillulae PL171]|uniref:Uncharacterized protein n=1 Tax=Catenaria anguillulae PL171 TaxID=765915 RepID=A0A1Y2HUP8_9FUNG|nr:hypothetical protein BCR44DRAFT_34135 [Catenaria anguillulae PL171]
MNRLARLLCALAIAGHVASAIFIDYCSFNEFERLFDRSDLLSVDFRNPEVHRDITRYKRDLADGTKFQTNTFITWRFPNGQVNNRLFIVLNEMLPGILIPGQNDVVYAVSNDARAFTTVPASAITSTVEPLNAEWTRRNVSISLAQPARYFRITWPDCAFNEATQRATCLDYYSPSILHFCAANTAAGEVANVRTCYPTGELNPEPVNPTTRFCSARMINDFWDFRLNGATQNLLGAYSSADGSMSRVHIHFPKQGLGQGMRALNVNRAGAYWVEALHVGTACFDASRFTHLHLEFQARAGFAADVVLESGPAEGRCNERGGPTGRVATGAGGAGVTWTAADPTKQKVVIPLASYVAQGVNLRALRAIVINNYVNPSNGWVYMDNIAFTGAASPAPFVPTPNAATYRTGQLSVPRLAFGCVNPTARFGATNPTAVKFSALASVAGTRFDINIRTSTSTTSCSRVSVIRVPSTNIARFTLDDLGQATEFVVPLPAGRLVSGFEIVNVRGATAGSVAEVRVSNVRIGLAGCTEAADPIRPDWEPRPYPVGVSRAFADIFPAPVVG